MTGRQSAESALRALGRRPDDAIDLGEGALALAALDRPQADLAAARAHIAGMAREVARRAGSQAALDDRRNALVEVIRLGHGYRGDAATYDDLRNANLIDVIERRKGLPVALGILYIQVARAQGWSARGLDFPGHFLFRLEAGGERAVMDAFHDGRLRDAAELRELLKAVAGLDAELRPRHYRPVGDRDVLLRLQNNVKTRHLRDGRLEAAARTIDDMLLFAPDRAALWREAGVVRARLGNLRAAAAAFEAVLERAPDDRARDEARAVLRRLRNKIN